MLFSIFWMIILAIVVGNIIEIAARLLTVGSFEVLAARYLTARATITMTITGTGITPLLYYMHDVGHYLPRGESLGGIFFSALLVEMILSRVLISAKKRHHPAKKSTAYVPVDRNTSAQREGMPKPLDSP